MEKIRIQFEDSMGNFYYVYNTNNNWFIVSRTGVNEAFSNFSNNPMLLKFALEDAKNSRDVLSAIEKYTRAINPYILGSL